MINFAKIADMIPPDGRLVLTFSKVEGKSGKAEQEQTDVIRMVYAPQFKGKESDQDLAPIVLTGTIPDLTAVFDGTMGDLASDQMKLASLKTRQLPSASSRVADKRKTVTAAITKQEKAGGGQKDEKKQTPSTTTKEPVKPPKPEPPMIDLFSSSKPVEPVQAKPVEKAVEVEEKPNQDMVTTEIDDDIDDSIEEVDDNDYESEIATGGEL